MKDHSNIIKWAVDSLRTKDYSLQSTPKVVVETPWSNVIQFSTSNGDIYLKQMPPSISLEPQIMQLLEEQFHASVPTVVDINIDLHCFLMKDAGQVLRGYLKNKFQPDLLCRAIMEFTTIQRAIENQLHSFLLLGVPDWRLDRFPKLYNDVLAQEEFLKADGMADEELQLLHDLSPQISEQCGLLSKCGIPETLVQTDFHSNNILFDSHTQKITFIDLGETVITHPFFSLHTFLRQTIIHHGVKERDQIYDQLQEACFKNWMEFSKNQLLEGFKLAKKIWPIYSALGVYRLMNGVDMEAFKSYYADRPHRLVGYFREYISFL